MKFPRFLLSLLLPVVSLLLSSSPASSASRDDWLPIDPVQLASKTPVVDKDADAEAIFWEVKVDDDAEGLVFTHYVRIKVFTDRGRESESRIDIPFGNFYGSEVKIKDIAARTIKPDGSVVELKKEDVFERTIAKASGAKVKAKSFAMPGVEPGSIIDYRWREVRVGGSANYLRLQFQREIPVQKVRYLIKPYPYEGYGMRAETFHGTNSPFAKEKNGFYSTTMTNMPAFKEEPRMPPEDQVRTWMLLYYTKEDKIELEKFWRDWGKAIYEVHKSDVKANDDVRKAAAEAVGDATTPEEKLKRLFDYTRAKVKNAYDDALGLTPEERAKIKKNKSPSDTLKRGKGTSEDIDMLFAALAVAAGLDAHVVELPDRSDFFFDQSFPSGYFLRLHCIAVQVDGQWRFYDPASAYSPFGMMPWWKEGVKGLVLDGKEPVWVSTPMSAADKSRVKRVAKLKLSDDGTIEGDVHVEYTGQFAIEKKEENDDDSPAQREDTLKEQIKAQMSTAEVSGIRIENVTDPVKPFVYSYHVRVPGYAQRTGKRIFLQPAFFEHGMEPMFSGSERRHMVYFHYPWSEEDEVTFELPTGYALDSADAPSPFSGGIVSDYKPSAAVSKDGKMLIYKRSFFFGGGGNILFPLSGYNQLKAYFEMMHKQDNHTITLKQGAATAPSN